MSRFVASGRSLHAALLVLLLAVGCGSGDDPATSLPGQGNPIPPLPPAMHDPGLFEGTPLDLFSLSILRPTSAGVFVTSEDTADLAGTAMGDADQLTWRNVGTGASGVLTPAPQWRALVPLQVGDNMVIVEARRGAAVFSDALCIVRTLQPCRVSELRLSPGHLLVGVSTTVTATITVHCDPLPTAVELWEIDDDGERPIAKIADMVDDGAGADESAGDSIYTARGSFTPATAKGSFLRARVAHAGGDFFGPPALLLGSERLDPVAVQAALDLQTTAATRYGTERNAGRTHAEAIQALLDLLDGSGLVKEAGRAGEGGGVWAVYAAGFSGGIFASPPGTRGGGKEACVPVPDASGTVMNTLDPSHAIETPVILSLLESKTCIEYDPLLSHLSAMTSVEAIKNAGHTGVFAISTHGDSWYHTAQRHVLDPLFGHYAGVMAAGDALAAALGHWPDGPQVIFRSGEAVTLAQMTAGGTHEADISGGRLVVCSDVNQPSGFVLGITPGFVSTYMCLPRSIVYVGCCRSAFNATMADAFLERGASAYIGYDDYVDSGFCVTKATEIFTRLCQGWTLGQAWTGREDHDTIAPNDPYPARMVVSMHPGNEKVRLPVDGIKNSSFEDGSRANGMPRLWQGGGVRRAVRLGEVWPEPRDDCNWQMAEMGPSAVLRQTVCVPARATTIKIRFDMLSRDWKEDCDSVEPMMTFKVTLGPLTLVDLHAKDICDGVTLVDAGFSPSDDGTWHTGWLQAERSVAHLRGLPLELELETRTIDNRPGNEVLVDWIDFELED